jgi:hypothetical protein
VVEAAGLTVEAVGRVRDPTCDWIDSIPARMPIGVASSARSRPIP